MNLLEKSKAGQPADSTLAKVIVLDSKRSLSSRLQDTILIWFSTQRVSVDMSITVVRSELSVCPSLCSLPQIIPIPITRIQESRAKTSMANVKLNGKKGINGVPGGPLPTESALAKM